jgi:hypothetical protein
MATSDYGLGPVWVLHDRNAVNKQMKKHAIDLRKAS